ncbi:hypothetical protein JG687_00015945 [Phytophthora cactorum]|uniref:Intramolecular chaperone auto-processing domain n=1 Tax=Phytophthora cactorum TaxID=29920 RepID=A0A8T1TSD0_9STRA|nr:hypothetical protein JG687_00015945 [Phytophthora cactorum]
MTATQSNITLAGTLANLTLDMSGTGLNIPSLKFNGTTSNQTYFINITEGGADPSKAVVLNSTKYFSGIRNLTCSGTITGSTSKCFYKWKRILAYGNQTAITTVGPLTELGINNNATTEYFNIKGSGMNYLDGSYTRMLCFIGSNITPDEFQIEVANGTNATSSNATWLGNKTNNDLRFGTNDSTTMILTTTGRLGVGTASPSAPLHVPSNNLFTFGTGGSTVYRLRTDGGNTESALGPISYNVSAIFGGYIACTAMAMNSDRRLKKNIQMTSI